MDCYELKGEKICGGNNSIGNMVFSNVSSSMFNCTDDKTPVADPLLCDARLKTFSPTPTNYNMTAEHNFFKQSATPIMRMAPPSNSSTPRISDLQTEEFSSNYNSMSLKTNDTGETSGIGSITTDDSDQLLNNILSSLKEQHSNANSNYASQFGSAKLGSQQSTQLNNYPTSLESMLMDNYGGLGTANKNGDLSLEDLLLLKQRSTTSTSQIAPTSSMMGNLIQNEKLNDLLQQEDQNFKQLLNEKLLSQNLMQQLLSLNNASQAPQGLPRMPPSNSALVDQWLGKPEERNQVQNLSKNAELLKLLNSMDSSQNAATSSLLNINNNNGQTNSADVMNDVNNMALYYKFIYGAPENEIEKAAHLYRNSANSIALRGEERAQWTGNVTKSLNSNVIFSRKVFLGGVPWDITTDELIGTFRIYGDLTVHWPNRDGGSSVPAAPHSRAPKAGYCYLLFESDIGVKRLMDHCSKLGNAEGCYYRMRSPKFKQKEVQVIPWVVSDSTYQRTLNVRIDNKKTVFVGALHGMITAEMLFTIMDTLFANVVFAALDTDKYKYPIGSGRVSFSTQTSYLNAVTTNFVDVQTSRFNKTIQIDPYLEDSMCNHCFVQPGIYFCRSFECFRYFCPACWNLWHNKSLLSNHKPLRRSFKCSNNLPTTNQLTDFR